MFCIFRSPADGETHKHTLPDTCGNGNVTLSNNDDQLNASLVASRSTMKEALEEAVADTLSSCHFNDDHNRQTESYPRDDGSGRDENMERVLEKHAMLIGQFQAEENAQREWEQKYNERKISTQVCLYTEEKEAALVCQYHVFCSFSILMSNKALIPCPGKA